MPSDDPRTTRDTAPAEPSGFRRPPASAPGNGDEVADGDVELVRSEEELLVGTRRREAGRVRVRRSVDVEHVREPVTRIVEDVETEVVPVDGPDDGEVRTLEDGTLSIPRFEEQLVVERRRVVVERVLLRRVPREVTEVVEADLAREHLVVYADHDVADRVVPPRPEDDVQP